MRRARPATLLAFSLLALALFGQARPETSDAPRPSGEYERYAVAADHPLASDAGAEVLAAGGNAADAAAATMLALGVVSPASSGLGGGGFALYYRASDRSLHFLDFRERAPAAATADMFARREGDDDRTAASRSRVGGLAVAVPGEPAGIDALVTRFGSGSVTRAQIVAPALRYATEGFEASSSIEEYSRWVGDSIRRDPVLGRWFPAGQSAIPAGHRLTNPEQARTLRELAARGAEAFYRGRIAREIVRRVRAEGGILTLEDLAAYQVAAREPLVADRLGFRWASAPPPSAGGVTMLASLALFERWVPPAHRRADSAFFRHALAESWKGPYSDRQLYLGDPDHVDVPTAALLTDARADARARAFHPTLAQATARYDLPLAGRETRPAVPGSDAGTSHLCVVDAEGNVASVTTTAWSEARPTCRARDAGPSPACRRRSCSRARANRSSAPERREAAASSPPPCRSRSSPCSSATRPARPWSGAASTTRDRPPPSSSRRGSMRACAPASRRAATPPSRSSTPPSCRPSGSCARAGACASSPPATRASAAAPPGCDRAARKSSAAPS